MIPKAHIKVDGENILHGIILAHPLAPIGTHSELINKHSKGNLFLNNT